MDSDSVLIALGSARQALEVAAARWTVVLLLGASLVAVGVIVEVIALVAEIREDKRSRATDITEEPRRHWLAAPHPPLWPKHRILEVVGAMLVALGVSAELYAEYRRGVVETELRLNNASAQAELTETANKATASAVESAKKVGGLGALVEDTGNKVDALTKTASDQKAHSDAIIATLNAKQKEVVATIEAAQKDESVLRSSVDTIRDLRERIRVMTADRVLTKEQINALTLAAKPLAHIDFDVATALTSEAWTFGKQIATALQAAGWNWKPRPMFPALALKGVPDIGNDTREGLILEACKSDVPALDPSAGFIKSQLSKDGFSFTGSWYEDADATSKAEPCGRLHIIVGAKY